MNTPEKSEQPAPAVASSDLLACAEIGARWRANSSLEEWFPFSAQKLKALEAEVGNAAAIIVKQNQAIERLKDAGDSLARHTREAKAIHGIDGDACADNWEDAKQANQGRATLPRSRDTVLIWARQEPLPTVKEGSANLA